MKSNKPIAVILFGIAIILITPGYIARDAFFDMIAFPIAMLGLFISFIGLFMAFREK